MQVTINDSLVVPKVKEAILSDDKVVLLYGWRSGGKSTSVIIVLVLLCVFSPRFVCAHVRQYYNELELTNFRTIQDVIHELGLSDYFVFLKKHFLIIYKPDPTKYFFGASGDRPSKARSVPNLTHIFWDEMHDCTLKNFADITGTVRNKADVTIKTKFIGVFNNDKVARDSFIYKSFFEKKIKDIRTVLISHLDNPFIDQDATREHLLNVTCFGDEEKYNSLVRGDFVEEDEIKKWCEYLEPEKHFSSSNLIYDPNLPLYIYFDNNYNPFVAIFIQYDKLNKTIKVLEEVSFEKSTPDDLHHYAVTKYPYSTRIWGGDKSAEMIFKSLYNLEAATGVRSAVVRFCRGDYNANYAKINPNFDNNFTTVNTVLRYFPTLQISPLCPNLRKEMIAAKIDNKKGGFTLYKVGGDSKYSMNFFDAFRYFVGDHLKDFVSELKVYQ